MKVTYGLGKARASRSTAIAIGIFDGVHRGHAHLIDVMKRQARLLNAQSTIVTFFPHPAHVLRPGHQLPYLMSLAQRLEYLEGLGVEHVVVVNFNRRLAAMAPEYFIEKYLVNRLKAKSIIVGEDFKFGQDRRGDIFLFERLSKVYDYTFIGVKAVTLNGQPISSTRLRGLVAEGNLREVKKLLGRPFSVVGKVVKGDGRGRKIGFPTANVAYEGDVVPVKGVYAVKVLLRDKIYPAVANLGVRPTFKSSREGLHLEVHLIKAKVNCYGQRISVAFIKKIREEKQFPNASSLQKQIKQDILKASRILS